MPLPIAEQGVVFSGTDIRAAILFRSPIRVFRTNRSEPEQLSGTARTDVWFQTITLSTMRATGPVRAIGSSSPKGYTRGGRTFAGSMVLSLLSRDQFAKFSHMPDNDQEILSFEEFFIDQLPDFDILIYGSSEHYSGPDTEYTSAQSLLDLVGPQGDAYSGAAVILGVHLVNYGTTYSIHDLIVENTYTYEATGYLPFSPNPLERIKAYYSPTRGLVGARRLMSELREPKTL